MRREQLKGRLDLLLLAVLTGGAAHGDGRSAYRVLMVRDYLIYNVKAVA